MKTKPARNDTRPVETSAPAPVANPSAPAPISEEKINRLSFPLDASGQPDWDKMHGKTREKLKALGIGGTAIADSPKPIVEVFDPAWCGAIFDTVGKVEAFAATKLYKFSPEVADKAFTYSQVEKDKLAGPTAKVINKYAPEWLEKFKDEIALAMLFVTITAVKFQMASLLMAQQKAMAGKSSAPGPVAVPASAPDLSTVENEILRVAPDGTITYKEGIEQKN